MSDINLDFTVSNNSIQFTIEPTQLTFTPEDIQLTINPSYSPGAGGNVTELQYNNGSLLAGIPTATYDGSNLSLGDVANLKITGGTNGYVLQTDGTGNLNWTAAGGGGGGNGTPGGANTQVQFNDSGLFAGNSTFTFNKTTGRLSSNSANIGGTTITANGIITPGVYGDITGANVIDAVYGNFTTLQVNSDAIYLGFQAGANTNILSQSIAIGYSAGYTNHGTDAIAIGDGAGQTNQGNFSIAIGSGAGFVNQPDNSIILNASNAYVNGNAANALFIKPVRNTYNSNIVLYNQSSGEVSYDTISNVSANITTLGTLTSNITTTETFGYANGAGGTVTQLTSRTSPVTLNKPTGKITLFTATLSANSSSNFTLNNTYITANDLVYVTHVSGGTLGGYNITATPGNGNAVITLRNNSTGAYNSQTPVLQFAVIKAVVV